MSANRLHDIPATTSNFQDNDNDSWERNNYKKLTVL